jgi:hypothetical protein
MATLARNLLSPPRHKMMKDYFWDNYLLLSQSAGPRRWLFQPSFTFLLSWLHFLEIRLKYKILHQHVSILLRLNQIVWSDHCAKPRLETWMTRSRY